MRVSIIGSGSWGTALAIHAANAGHTVQLWSRNEDVITTINDEHLNRAYLPEFRIPDAVVARGDLSAVVDDAELLILAAPSHATRDLINAMRDRLRQETIVISATKGIETESGKRISQVFADVTGERAPNRFVCLSGPSFAREVAQKHPTAVVAASVDVDAGRQVQAALSFDNLRIYTNEDLIGTELGGSIKNVMAIAAGMVAGLGFGSNSVAALITRGLTEMTRLTLREGGKIETLMGLAGLGDLVLTCTGSLSRNRHVGEELGKGKALDEITGPMHEIAEGIKTTLAVKRLAESTGVEMPITNEVYGVLYEAKSAKDAAMQLMTRPLRPEGNW